jgi:hypothetical protein
MAGRGAIMMSLAPLQYLGERWLKDVAKISGKQPAPTGVVVHWAWKLGSPFPGATHVSR